MGEAETKNLLDFFEIAIGSSSELEYQLLLSHDFGFIKDSDFKSLTAETVEVKKMMISFFQKLKANG